MDEMEIQLDDPRRADVRDLLARHLAFAYESSPREDVHALDIDGLCEPSIAFFSLRIDGELLGVGAIKRLDERHGEIKSMHTAVAARGRGIAWAMLQRLLRHARESGITRVSLETGSTEVFAPARALYAKAGFSPCAPFADYAPSPHSFFMTLSLAPIAPEPE
jgi:putative acetyltransferase